MKPIKPILAGFLILALALPSPAWALRAGIEEKVEQELSAGLEENWTEQVKRILRAGYGTKVDQLTRNDLLVLRLAGNRPGLLGALRAYGAALGKGDLNAKTLDDMANAILVGGWLFTEAPSGPPSPGLFVEHARIMPQAIQPSLFSLLRTRQASAEEFSRMVGDVRRAMEFHVRTFGEGSDPWVQRLHPLVEGEFTPQHRDVIRRTAERVAEALLLEKDAPGKTDWLDRWISQVYPSNLEAVLEHARRLDIPFAPEANSPYKRFFMTSVAARLRNPTFTSKAGEGLDLIFVSWARSGSMPVFAGDAAHELVHQGIAALPERIKKRFALSPAPHPGVSREDWFTVGAESVICRWEADQTAEEPVLPVSVLGPAITRWLEEEGRETARAIEMEQWSSRFAELMAYFPPGLQEYAMGKVIGGIAAQLGEEAAQGDPLLNPHEQALSFVLGDLIRTGEGAYRLEQIPLAARVFRSKHGLPEGVANAAGLEEKRRVAMAREMAVAALMGISPAAPGTIPKRALVFTDAEMFDLAALAVRWDWTVAVPYDGPEAAGLEELLRRVPPPKGIYAVGSAQAAQLLRNHPEAIRVRNRPHAFELLGLRWDDLPRAVAAGLEAVRAFLDTATAA